MANKYATSVEDFTASDVKRVATPDNSLITARDAGTDEIYALDWEAP